MKKVLFVINTMGQAGAEKSMVELMKVMDTSVYELYLRVLVNRGEMYNEVPPYVNILNKKIDNRPILSMNAKFSLLKIVFTSMFYRGNIFRNFTYLVRNLKEQIKKGHIQYDKLFWKLISDGTPVNGDTYDIAIAYLEGGAAYFVADHVKADRKAAFIHIDYKRAGYSPLIDHGCYEKFNQLFFVSEEAKQSFLEVYPELKERARIFYNIINAEAIKNLADTGQGFEDKFDGIRIVTVGRLHYQKAYDITIQVLAKLRAEGYPVRWYVLGDGALRKELEKLIQKFNLIGEFVLLGAKSNPYPYIKQCDLYVHATRFEGKSIAIEEAKVLGKAIIASDCPGNREQITNNQNGLLVDLMVDDICEGIKKLLGDRQLLSNFEKVNATEEFSNRKNLEALYSFMEETI